MTNLAYTIEYLRNYDPAKPILELEVSLPGRPQSAVAATMLVDSGADQTMVELNILQSLNAKPIDYIRINSLFGASRTTELYVVDLYVRSLHIHAVEVAALPAGDENIIGRDVLNQLIVTLNGLAGVTEVAG